MSKRFTLILQRYLLCLVLITAACNKTPLVDNSTRTRCPILFEQYIKVDNIAQVGAIEQQILTSRGWSGFYSISYTGWRPYLINDSTFLITCNLSGYLAEFKRGDPVYFRIRLFDRHTGAMRIMPAETLYKP